MQFLACTACRVVIRSNTLARGGSRVRATRTVPRLQVRPVVSHNEDLNSLNSLRSCMLAALLPLTSGPGAGRRGALLKEWSTPPPRMCTTPVSAIRALTHLLPQGELLRLRQPQKRIIQPISPPRKVQTLCTNCWGSVDPPQRMWRFGYCWGSVDPPQHRLLGA